MIMNELYWPLPLTSGDIVALTAPSSPISTNRLNEAVKSLELLELIPIVMDSCTSRCDYLAGDDIRRASDLNRAFSQKNIKGIFCLRGGYGSMRLLPHLDFNMIKKNPKIFIGYSDITALHTAINHLCGFVTFHGPMPGENYCTMDSFTITSLKNSLFYPKKLKELKNPQGLPLEIFKDSISAQSNPISGILTGGNLSLLASTLGTPYEINTKNKILFIEDTNEDLYRIDRYMTSLSLAGKFRDCCCILLGNFSNCGDSKTLHDIFRETIRPWKKPTLFNFRAGHIYPQSTLPLGAQISIDFNIPAIFLL